MSTAALSVKDVIGWLLLIFFTFVVLRMWYLLPRMWRGELRWKDERWERKAPPGWVLTGDHIWRNGDAAYPIGLVAGTALIGAFWAQVLMPTSLRQKLDDSSVVTGLVVGGLWLAIALVVSAIGFNRPKFLIPPPWRKQGGGAFREWRAERTRKRERGRRPDRRNSG